MRGRGICLAFLSLRVGTASCRISYKAYCVLELDAGVIMMAQRAPPSYARASDPPPEKVSGALPVYVSRRIPD